jgi:hypothetical protein
MIDRCNQLEKFFFTLCLAGVVLPSFAGGVPDLPEALNKLKSGAVSATVIVVHKHSAFVVPVTAKTLPKHGCSHLYKDPADIASLIDVLGNGDLKEFKDGGDLDIRLGLTFTDKDGRETTLLFEQLVGRDRRVKGRFDTAPVSSNEYLPDAIRAWVARTKSNAAAVTGFCIE